MQRVLIVMAKDPRPGLAKTRLIPSIGAAAAAGLYRAFLQDVLDTSALVRAERRIYAHPPESLARVEELGLGRYRVRPQVGPTLSERMVAAFGECFAEGADAVVMRNSDSPTLPAAVVTEAFERLEKGADLVLGPDLGGGYYLVGLRKPCPDLFRGFAMSTSSVLDETLRRARGKGLAATTLVRWLDIDTGDDLVALMEQIAAGSGVERADCPRTTAFLSTLSAWRLPPGKTVPVPGSAGAGRTR
jgi:rSAM/selenodomain-associated transferase 1